MVSSSYLTKIKMVLKSNKPKSGWFHISPITKWCRNLIDLRVDGFIIIPQMVHKSNKPSGWFHHHTSNGAEI